MGKKLALFDFDGTMTSKDTMLEFIIHTRGKGRLRMSYIALSPLLMLMKLGLYRREKAKEKLLAWHFKGWTREDLEKEAATFCSRILPTLLRDKALAQLQHHRMQGHDVFIVTASLDLWLKPWLTYQKLPYAATQGEFVNDRFTGKLSSPNLHGKEKVNIIRDRFDLTQYETIYAYGDTRGDKPMLALAHIPRYKPFRGEMPIPGLDMR